ncbi:YccF domain-containing protein [Oceanidesulfovibrio marinus]|uniref:YccF domain-containing protein n=1 Tax=Oceanidesulfovibrio marinus TaxID=370038 RepID=A0A6P1ZNL4_9BACT|nr:YccF domain-containing protein [Oceanidesulfovibrio marinus]QJT09919.1 YccF domain-containing protein [Oceanidesulfovibrio marinus]TVM35965.1 YccF domain-containing protein [Oceanidesulfovibrio marinus]
MLTLILNVLWFILGGWAMGLMWWLAGIVMFITIIGIPWGSACFRIGLLAFWPFGRTVVHRGNLGQQDMGTGAAGFLGNVIWFVLAGIWLAIGHLLEAIALAITIIGIPFAFQHLKLARITLAPIGTAIVDTDVWEQIRLKG